MQQFVTHTGEIISGNRLSDALNAVADWYKDNAFAIYRKDEYASHVTEECKEENLYQQLQQAKRIRTGNEHCGFWLWQRINTELTGNCIGFLPKAKGE